MSHYEMMTIDFISQSMFEISKLAINEGLLIKEAKQNCKEI